MARTNGADPVNKPTPAFTSLNSFDSIYSHLTTTLGFPVLPSSSPYPRSKSLSHQIASLSIHPTLEALLHILNNDLPSAHFLCRHMQNAPAWEGMFIHGLLHRVEGDYRNAEAWYGNVDQSECFGHVWPGEGGLEDAKGFIRAIERVRKEKNGDKMQLERESRREIERLVQWCKRAFGTGSIEDATKVWVEPSEEHRKIASKMLLAIVMLSDSYDPLILQLNPMMGKTASMAWLPYPRAGRQANLMNRTNLVTCTEPSAHPNIDKLPGLPSPSVLTGVTLQAFAFTNIQQSRANLATTASGQAPVPYVPATFLNRQTTSMAQASSPCDVACWFMRGRQQATRNMDMQMQQFPALQTFRGSQYVNRPWGQGRLCPNQQMFYDPVRAQMGSSVDESGMNNLHQSPQSVSTSGTPASASSYLHQQRTSPLPTSTEVSSTRLNRDFPSRSSIQIRNQEPAQMDNCPYRSVQEHQRAQMHQQHSEISQYPSISRLQLPASESSMDDSNQAQKRPSSPAIDASPKKRPRSDSGTSGTQQHDASSWKKIKTEFNTVPTPQRAKKVRAPKTSAQSSPTTLRSQQYTPVPTHQPPSQPSLPAPAPLLDFKNLEEEQYVANATRGMAQAHARGQFWATKEKLQLVQKYAGMEFRARKEGDASAWGRGRGKAEFGFHWGEDAGRCEACRRMGIDDAAVREEVHERMMGPGW